MIVAVVTVTLSSKEDLSKSSITARRSPEVVGGSGGGGGSAHEVGGGRWRVDGETRDRSIVDPVARLDQRNEPFR